MSNQEIQPAERGPRWPGYIMFSGVIGIVASILLRSVMGPASGYNDIFSGIGYAGFFLFFVGFLIFATVND